jgi:hypothetical protein
VCKYSSAAAYKRPISLIPIITAENPARPATG